MEMNYVALWSTLGGILCTISGMEFSVVFCVPEMLSSCTARGVIENFANLVHEAGFDI